MLVCAFLLVAARTGTVRIHLTDGHNRPIANHEVWLTDTNSSEPVRPFGVLWGIPGGHYHGTTNKSGDVAIREVRLRKPMMVVMQFGSRFEKNGGGRNVIKFDGAVYAGRSAHVTLAEDREITGAVTDGGGKPLKDVTVVLSDTGFGHLGGIPGPPLDIQKSDERGAYRFTQLPNCAFIVMAQAGANMAVESRTEKGPWQLLAIVGQEEMTQPLTLSKPRSECDFRIDQTSKLTVIFKAAPSELKGWTAWVSKGTVATIGQNLDYDSSSSTVKRRTLPGQVTIWLTRDNGERRLAAKKLTLKPGESRTIEISIADVLRRKSRRNPR